MILITIILKVKMINTEMIPFSTPTPKVSFKTLGDTTKKCCAVKYLPLGSAFADWLRMLFTKS